MLVLVLLACGPEPFPIPDALDGGDATDSGDTDSGHTDDPCADADPAALYDPDVVHTVALTVAAADLDALLAAPDNYVPADVLLDGAALPGARVRLRGDTTQYRWDGKPSFKVDLRDSTGCPAVDRLALDGNADDPAQAREVLAAALLGELGILAPRAAFATVTVNDESFGLYTSVEVVDDAFVAQRLGDADGVMWEGGDAADLSEVGAGDWDDVYGSGDPDTLAAVAAVVDTAGDNFYAEADTLVAMDDVLTTWAGIAALGHDQSWPYEPGDAYLWAPATDGRLRLVPWDLDEGWDPKFTWNGASSAFGARCVTDPTCEAALRAAVADTADTLAGIDARGLAAGLFSLTTDAVADDTHRDFSTSEVSSARTALRGTVDGWPDTLRAQLHEER